MEFLMKKTSCVVLLLMLIQGHQATYPDYALLQSVRSTDTISNINIIWNNPQSWLPSLGTGNNNVATGNINSRSPGVTFGVTAVDNANHKLYWHNSGGRSIMALTLRRSLTGFNVQTFSAPCSDKVNGMTYDWLSKNLYWTDSVYNWIMMASVRDKRIFKIIIDTDLKTPHGIVVHPNRSELMWTDSQAMRIERSDLSGGQRTTVLTGGASRPTAIAREGNTVYWIDAALGRLVIMAWDGSSSHSVSDTFFRSVIDLDVFADLIFVTNTSGSIQILNGTNSVYSRRNVQPSRTATALGLSVMAPQKQPGSYTPCIMARCPHMCVSEAGNSRANCLCHHLYSEQQELTCQLPEEASVSSPSFFYNNGTNLLTIRAWAPDKPNINPGSLLPRALTAFAVTHNDNMLYYAVSTSINAVRLATGSTATTIIYGLVKDVKGIAVDWLSQNMYWTDAFYRHIMVAKTDGRYSRVLRGGLTGVPLGIAVSPQNKYTILSQFKVDDTKLFWVEGPGGSVTGRIWSAYTDGSGASVLVGINVVSPKQLTIDHGEQRLYWTDATRRVIESVNFMGTDRQSLTLPARPYGVAVFQDYIGWTSQDLGHSGVYFNRKGSSTPTRFIREQMAVSGIQVYWSTQQPDGTSHCALRNGGCSQLCLPSQTARVCSCAVGYSLSSNGMTCVSKFGPLTDNFLLLTDSFRKELYQMDVNTGSVRAILVNVSHDNPVALDYHPHQAKLYWSDVSSKQIRSVKVDGTGSTLITEMPGSVVDGLAVDYIRNLLYIADAFQDRICMMNLNGQMRTDLITSGLQAPRAIVLDLNNRLMYWTDLADDPASSYAAKIERASAVDGSGRTVLVGTTLKWPNALTIDFQAGKMYWAEAFYDKIESANVDGSNRQTLVFGSNTHFFALTHDNLFLFITDWNKRGVTKVNRQTGALSQLGPFEFERLNAIKLYKSSLHNLGSATPPSVQATPATNQATPRARAASNAPLAGSHKPSHITPTSAPPRVNATMSHTFVLKNSPHVAVTCKMEVENETWCGDVSFAWYYPDTSRIGENDYGYEMKTFYSFEPSYFFSVLNVTSNDVSHSGSFACHAFYGSQCVIKTVVIAIPP